MTSVLHQTFMIKYVVCLCCKHVIYFNYPSIGSTLILVKRLSNINKNNHKIYLYIDTQQRSWHCSLCPIQFVEHTLTCIMRKKYV